MAIMVKCKCGAQFKAPIEYAGRAAHCPKCKAALRVPDPAKDAVPLEEVPPGDGSRATTGRSAVPAWLAVVLLLFIIGGGIGLYIYHREAGIQDRLEKSNREYHDALRDAGRAKQRGGG